MDKNVRPYTGLYSIKPSLVFLVLGIMMIVGTVLLFIYLSGPYRTGLMYLLLACFGLTGCWIVFHNLAGLIHRVRE